jgi:iron-sulfur cluster assembly accessory protein
MVTMTSTAADRLRTILEQEGQAGKALRIRVVASGCSGYSYDMVFDDAQESDQTFEAHGLRLLVDEQSLPLLTGAEIDFHESFGSSGFTIKNPNAKGGCGCGKSFQA